jgi:hypothetical protein
MKARDWVAIIIAVGISVAINILVGGVLYESIVHIDRSGLSENATQILTGWGGGMIGVIGAYIGFQASRQQQQPPRRPDEEP